MNKQFLRISTPSSLNLSLILTGILFTSLVLSCFLAPYAINIYDTVKVVNLGLDSIYNILLVVFYFAVFFAIIALFTLFKMLINIKEKSIFIKQNTSFLRIISYCCFAEGIIFLLFGFCRPLGFVVAIAALFFGLILRAMKNIFAKAVEIKEENDYII